MYKIQNIIRGFRLWLIGGEEQLRNKRMKVCKPCEHRRVNVCGECGCVLEWKTRVLEEDCPKNKW